MRAAGPSLVAIAFAAASCKSPASPAAVEPRPVASSAPLAIGSANDGPECEGLRARANAMHTEGRLDSTLRLIAEADARCPSSASKSAALAATTRAELAPSAGADPFAMIAQAQQSLAAGRSAEARAGFSRALAALEAQRGARVRVTGFEASFTDPVRDNGSILALGRDASVFVYDARTFAPRARITAPGATDRTSVQALAPSPDSTKIAAGFGGPSFSIWDLRTGALLRTFEGHTKALVELAFSGDGRAVVSASEDKTVRVWDVETGRTLRVLPFADGLSAMTMSPNGNVVVGAPFKGPIVAYDVATGQAVKSLAPPKAQVMGLSFSSDGRTLAASVEDSPRAAIHLYDFASGQLRRSFSLVEHASLSPDGSLLAGSHEGGLRVIDLSRGLPILEKKNYQRPHFLPDGSLVVLDDEGSVLAIDPRTGKARTVVPTGRAPLSVTFGLGARMVSLTRSGVELCDLAPKLDCRELGGKFRSAGYTPRGTTLAVIRDDDGSVDVYDARLQKTKNLLGHADTHLIPQHNAHLVLSADGRRAATVEYQIHVLDLEAGTEAKVPKMDGHGMLAMSDDGAWLATSLGPNVGVYDATSGKRTELRGHKGGVSAIAFSSDARLVASGGSDKTIRVFDVASQSNTQTAEVEPGRFGGVKAIAFSPDGRRIVAGVGTTGRIFDLDGMRPVATLAGATRPVFGVAFRPDGRVVATSSTDGFVRLWSAEGKHLASVGFLEGDSAYAISPGGDRVEAYGNARKWLACEVGAARVPFEVCEDRVGVEGLLAALGP